MERQEDMQDQAAERKRKRLGDIKCGILGVRRVEIPKVRLTDH